MPTSSPSRTGFEHRPRIEQAGGLWAAPPLQGDFASGRRRFEDVVTVGDFATGQRRGFGERSRSARPRAVAPV